MRRYPHFGLTFAALIALSSCEQTPPLQSTPPTSKRDLAAFARTLEAAGVANTDPFQPQLRLKTCPASPLPKAAMSDKLAAAVNLAQLYSDSHKGTGLIVMRDGAILHEQYGVGGSQENFTNSFSMHKSLLALTVGAAVDRGIISSIDIPVGKLIDEWRNDPRGKISLERFLRMESGLVSNSSNPLELGAGEHIDAHTLATPASVPPGTVFRYQNIDSQIAGIALDRALRKHRQGDYAAFLSKTIWCPIGAGPASLWLDKEGGSPRYYAGLFTTLRSWARVGELIRTGGKVGDKDIVSKFWIDAMTKASPTNANYGLQLWLGSPWVKKRHYNAQNPISIMHENPYLADDVVFFDGFGGQRVYVIPSRGITIVRAGQVDLTYDDSVIVNLVLRANEN